MLVKRRKKATLQRNGKRKKNKIKKKRNKERKWAGDASFGSSTKLYLKKEKNNKC